VSRQEAFNAWALQRLGVVPPQKVEYRDESLDAIRARMQSVFGVSLEDVETSWLAILRG
jgi:hypothetical protein